MGRLLLAYYDSSLGRRRVSQQFLDRAERALKKYYGDTTEQTLREAVKKIRPHASFFKWTNKETEELGVVQILIEAVESPPLEFRRVRPGTPDPPDVVGEREDGSEVAIEVTELVDEEVTGRNVRAVRKGRAHEAVYREWDRPALLAAIEERLKAKDSVKLHGGPYDDYVVALHTDEMALTHAEAESWLAGHTFVGLEKVTSAYLLFSYDGATQRYPYVLLSVAP